jgi:hypothetical protein
LILSSLFEHSRESTHIQTIILLIDIAADFVTAFPSSPQPRLHQVVSANRSFGLVALLVV